MRSHVYVHRRFENEDMRLKRVAAAAGAFQHLAYTGNVIWYVLYMAALGRRMVGVTPPFPSVSTLSELL
jgi:hypothetical protein